jgi:hypothetical protein
MESMETGEESAALLIKEHFKADHALFLEVLSAFQSQEHFLDVNICSLRVDLAHKIPSCKVAWANHGGVIRLFGD